MAKERDRLTEAERTGSAEALSGSQRASRLACWLKRGVRRARRHGGQGKRESPQGRASVGEEAAVGFFEDGCLLIAAAPYFR